jgi:ketosteroid isomerase-like protein
MTSQVSSQREIVQALYRLCAQGDWASAEALLTEDFFVIEADSLPFAGVYRGRGGLRQIYEIVFGSLDIAAAEIHEITTGEEYAVTLLDMVLAGDPPVRVPITEVFRFRDGKVCEIRPHYFDPAPIVTAVRARSARLSGPGR